jgi:hypothetical protein
MSSSLYKVIENTPQQKVLLLSWDEIKRTINFLDNMYKFERKKAVQLKYNRVLQNINTSVYQHIIDTELHIDNINSFGKQNKYTLVKNRYPYNFGTNLHYVLWIHPNCDKSTKSKIFNKDYIDLLLHELLENTDLLGNKDYIVFRNAHINQSINMIDHFHIIFKCE